MISLSDLQRDPETRKYLDRADEVLGAIGYTEHGRRHAGVVAKRARSVLEALERPSRLCELAGIASYLHDIGMVDLSAVGRRTHAVFAAHAAYGPDVTPLVDGLLAPGLVRDRLEAIHAESPFAVPLDVVVREILSTSLAHSKSSVPAPFLDDRAALRRLLQHVVFTPLDAHRANPARLSADDAAAVVAVVNGERYADPVAAFAWLDAASGPQAGLADDVIDAIRALRAADVLRQRGTVLRTSGGFELCMDSQTALAVCTLRPADGEAAYVIRYDDRRGAGEANIRVAFVTPQGNLRIAVHRGAFATEAATRRAVASVADVVQDIVADVIPSFSGHWAGHGLLPPTRTSAGIRIELERPSDGPEFADAVVALVAEQDPTLAERLVVVADVEGAAPGERLRYHASEAVEPDCPEADDVVRAMRACGVELAHDDRAVAFAEVRRAVIQPGETLAERGSPPAFVYVPTGPGLVVRPEGGYAPSPLHPWIPVGTTGVIRRAERNGAIVAEAEVVVIIIPAERYERAWLRPLGVDELVRRLRAAPASATST